MNKIDTKFKQLRARGEKALVSYIMMGDSNMSKTEELIDAIIENGGDIIELGIPYSDPLADGPVIEKAGERALANGFKLKQAFDCVRNIRKKSDVPLIFMCYYNTVFGYGRDKFIGECVDIGIDGLIVPDLPMEEREEIAPFLDEKGIALIPLVAITSQKRIPEIAKTAKGFLYCVSSMGVTGVRSNFHSGVNKFLADVKAHTDVPTCVGFGISKKEDIERFKPFVDGVIVGSALVNMFYKTNYDSKAVGCYIKELKSATKRNI